MIVKLVSPRYDEKTFFQKALDAYRLANRLVDFDVFYKEANRIIYIPKYLKRMKSLEKDQTAVRLVLNYLIIARNAFGDQTLTLLYSVADETVYPELNALLSKLNIYPLDGTVQTIYGEIIDLNTYSTDIEFIKGRT